MNSEQVSGLVTKNGAARVTVWEAGKTRTAEIQVSDLPAPVPVSGAWHMVLEAYQFERLEPDDFATCVVDRGPAQSTLLRHRPIPVGFRGCRHKPARRFGMGARFLGRVYESGGSNT